MESEQPSNRPVIVLVRTQLAQNIGMCARAMMNCGLYELRLISPEQGWPNQDAWGPAVGTTEILENAGCFETLEEAIADCSFVLATSARKRHLNLPALGLKEAVGHVHSHLEAAAANRVAVVFGPEASGLDNFDLSHVDRVVNYDMNPNYTSLNLAQAVLLFGWEWWSSPRETPVSPLGHTPTTKANLTFFLDRLESELEAGGYFPNELKRPITMDKLRTLFNRSQPTEQEIRGLHGVITALRKAGQKAVDR